MEKNEEINYKNYFALCPLDGRYREIGEKLVPYFSEYALVKNRVKVEIYWLKFLLENITSSKILNDFDKRKVNDIIDIYNSFSETSYNRIKEIEKITNHDVKAVELFIAEQLKEKGMESLISFVHFGCTSEDINNTAYSNMITTAMKEVWIPKAESILEMITNLAKENKNIYSNTNNRWKRICCF